MANRKKTDVTIFAPPFGFGPLGKAMAIAHSFERRGISVKVLTDDIGSEIVAATGLYPEIYQYKKELDLATLNSKLAISCLDISTPVEKSGIPLALYDSLFWLRGTWEHLPKYNEDIYIAQRFFTPPTEEAMDIVNDHFHWVDAILPETSKNYTNPKLGKRVVVYPGGLKSPHLPLEYQEQYLSWTVEAVLNAMKAAGMDQSLLTLICPPQLKSQGTYKKIKDLGGVVESAVDDLNKITSEAMAFVMAPGIETMLEACAIGKVPLYLPAYIAPHIPQLVALRGAGVGIELCPSFTDDVMKFDAKGENMGKMSKDMLDYNSKELYQPKFQKEIEQNLIKYLEKPYVNTDQFPLGKDGASQVVDILLPYLHERS